MRVGLPWVSLALLILVSNLLIDYFSLLETRWILSRIEPQSTARTIGLAVADYIITTGIWVVGFWILIQLIETYGGGNVPTPETIEGPFSALLLPFAITWEWLRGGAVASGKGVAVGHIIAVFGGSTYFTLSVILSILGDLPGAQSK